MHPELLLSQNFARVNFKLTVDNPMVELPVEPGSVACKFSKLLTSKIRIPAKLASVELLANYNWDAFGAMYLNTFVQVKITLKDIEGSESSFLHYGTWIPNLGADMAVRHFFDVKKPGTKYTVTVEHRFVIWSADWAYFQNDKKSAYYLQDGSLQVTAFN